MLFHLSDRYDACGLGRDVTGSPAGLSEGALSASVGPGDECLTPRRWTAPAGAGTPVMSLRKVADDQTQRADRGILPSPPGRRGPGRGPGQRNAMKAKYPDPYYWALICQGDPGPLNTLNYPLGPTAEGSD